MIKLISQSVSQVNQQVHVCKSASQLVNQPISKLVSQQVHVCKPGSQSVSKPISQLVNQSVGQSPSTCKQTSLNEFGNEQFLSFNTCWKELYSWASNCRAFYM